MASNEVRGHNMMTRLYNMNVMSWNVVVSDGCILQQSFGYIPRFDDSKILLSFPIEDAVDAKHHLENI